MFERARREQLSRIYLLRQEVREHHRLLGEQRDRFEPAAEAIRNLAGLSRGAKEYLRDVGDHLAQVTGEFHRQLEDLMSLAQTYFNANADRLNGTATKLTVVGTLFVTWTLVTGFFGQNFAWLVKNISSQARLPGLRRGRPRRADGRARDAVLGQAPRLVLTRRAGSIPQPLTRQSTREDVTRQMAVDVSQVSKIDAEPGELPPTMAAWVIRQEREGEPMDAFQLEEMETPEPGAFEVTVRVMAAGVNFNNVWAALGKPVSVFNSTRSWTTTSVAPTPRASSGRSARA